MSSWNSRNYKQRYTNIIYKNNVDYSLKSITSSNTELNNDAILLETELNNSVILDRNNNIFYFSNISNDIINCNYNIIYLNNDNINNYIVKGTTLHKSFNYLPDDYKQIYLYSYFMHYYGGYFILDKHNIIKNIDLNLLDNYFIISNKISSLKWFDIVNPLNMAIKSNTIFTLRWLERIHILLDKYYPFIINIKDNFEKNNISKQSLSYSILYPLIIEFNNKIYFIEN